MAPLSGVRKSGLILPVPVRTRANTRGMRSKCASPGKDGLIMGEMD